MSTASGGRVATHGTRGRDPARSPEAASWRPRTPLSALPFKKRLRGLGSTKK